MSQQDDFTPPLRRGALRELLLWFAGARSAGFKFGRCEWCGCYVHDLVPGEVLCESHWLQTK